MDDAVYIRGVIGHIFIRGTRERRRRRWREGGGYGDVVRYFILLYHSSFHSST